MSDNSLAVFDFKSNQVRVVFVESETWFIAKDICTVLEVGNVSAACSRLDDDEKGVALTDTLGGKQNMIIISESGVKRLVSRSRKPNAKMLAKELGIEVLSSPIESEYLLTIKKSFAHLNPVDQFFVNGFRIDLYFSEHRIAVECDENNHNDYDKIQEIKRQDSITQSLGCTWIRFNPHAKDFCIGDVINRLIKEIYIKST
jgi:very-short-patch-repair endonuclease